MIEWEMPWAFIGMLLALLLLGIFWGKKEKSLEGMIDKEILQRLQFSKQGLSSRTKYLLLCIVVALLSITLARPITMQKELSQTEKLHDVIIAIDGSASMQQIDLTPSRLDIAKEKLKSLIGSSKHLRIGVILYANDAYRIFPLSRDTQGMLYVLEQATFPKNLAKNSNLFAALEGAKKMLQTSTTKHIILLSDEADRVSHKEEAAFLKANHLTLHLLPIKKENSSHLKDLAIQSGGSYAPLTWSQKDIQSILDKIEQSKANDVTTHYAIKHKKEWFYLPLSLALILLFLLYHDIKLPKMHLLFLSTLLFASNTPIKAQDDQNKTEMSTYTSLPKSAQRDYNIATLHYRQHHYKKAISLYQNIQTKKPPLQAKIFHNIATAYLKLHNLQKAKSYFKKSVSSYPLTQSQHNLTEVTRMLHLRKQQKRKGKFEEKIRFKAIASTQNSYKQRSSAYTIKLRPLSLSQEEKWLQTLQKQKSPLFIQKIPTSKRSLDANNPH